MTTNFAKPETEPLVWAKCLSVACSILALFAACTGCRVSAKSSTSTIAGPAVVPMVAPLISTAEHSQQLNIRTASYRSQPSEEVFALEQSDQGNASGEGSGEGVENEAEQVRAEPTVASSIVFDAQRDGTPTDLSSLIAQALAVHPRVQAARQRVAALRSRIPQATALDDPVVGNTFWPIHEQALQTAGGRVGHQFSFAQKIPWPEKLSARGAVAQREAQVAIAEVKTAELEIVEAVRLAYYELWLADQLIEIVIENKELVVDLITIAETRFRSGGSQSNILRAELESDKLDDQLISLRRQKEQTRAELGTLVRQPMHLMPTTMGTLTVSSLLPDLELLIAEAERCNPRLQGLAAEIARDRAKQSLACLQEYPDFQVGLGYSIISDDRNVLSPVADGHDNINFSIGVSLPIWREKINAGVREATHQRNSTFHLREAERDRLRGQLRRQVAAADATVEQLQLFRDRLIPKTEQTLEIALADYRGKKADFIEVIETYRELLSYQVQVVRSKATLASTLAQIEKTAGSEAISSPQ